MCLNSEKTILNTIESIKNQAYENIEHVIIDGGSTDGTIELIKKEMIPDTVFVSEPDAGISDAFNKGISRASGEWIMFINSDDVLVENCIGKIIPQLPRKGILCPAAIWRRKSEEMDTIRIPNSNKLIQEMTVNHPGTLVHTDIFRDYGKFDTRYRVAMDYEFLLRMYQQGVCFKDCRTPVAIFNHGGISDQGWKQGLGEIRQAKTENGINPLLSSFYYLWQVSRRFGYDWALRLGLTRTINLARRPLSRMEEESVPDEPK